MDDPHSATRMTASLLKAWDDYVAASEVMWERFKNPAAAAVMPPQPFFAAWQEFAASLGINAESVAGAAPAFGPTRDYQHIVQRMAELGSQFQRRYAEFLEQSRAIGEQALQSVQQRAAAEPQLAASPAAAYDAWIDSAETAYAQAAHSEAFARSVGELCNLCSALKVERGKWLEALARHLDLPTRAEVDSLHRKVHELSRAQESRRK